ASSSSNQTNTTSSTPPRPRSPHSIKPDPAMAVSYTTSADVTRPWPASAVNSPPTSAKWEDVDRDHLRAFFIHLQELDCRQGYRYGRVISSIA
ncbi:hypothetical protein, partial [Micromonospora rubida]|uniref:hypothetical protein n=1 Tax=Micromonospora rubida TaxID=2697657 RepID=UPI001F15CFA8